MLGAELTPATAGASLGVAIIVIGADAMLGGVVGALAEEAYEFARDNSTELGNRSPTVFPY